MEKKPDINPIEVAGNDSDNTHQEPKLIVKDRRFWVDHDMVPTDPKKLEDRVPSYLETLKTQLESKDQKLREAIDSLKEEQENFKKRVERDIENRVDRIKMDLISSLLPALENLGRAVEAADKSHNFESLMEGIKMVEVQFKGCLKGSGVEEIISVGSPFDPRTDEAVQMIPVDEKDKDGLVILCLAPGYRLGDKIIRPAKVAIGKAR